MIVSFRNKGLKELFEDGETRRIDRRYWNRIIEQLSFLNIMELESDINDMSHWHPHRLTGKNPWGQDVQGHWSLKVSGNWRITYYFNNENCHVSLVDYLDYH